MTNINLFVFKVDLFVIYLKGMFPSASTNVTKADDEIKVTLNCSFLDTFRFPFEDSILTTEFDEIIDIYGNSISKLVEANTVMSDYINSITQNIGGEVSKWWDCDTSISISPSIEVYFNYTDYEIKITFKNEYVSKGFLKIFKFNEITSSELEIFIKDLKSFEQKNLNEYNKIMKEFATNTATEFSERFIKCKQTKHQI